MPVTQFDITESIGDVFIDGPKGAAHLADVAADRGARPAVVRALRSLTGGPYRDLHDVLCDLPDIPRDSDPWDATTAEDRSD